MHIIWENTVKNLVLLWTGGFKGIDTGRESYELGLEVWEAICKAMAGLGGTLPVVYCTRPPNLITERSACTADTWSFWTQYLGPVLLHQKFSKAKYYKQFVKLVKMLHVCLQFKHTSQDVEDLIYYLNDPECAGVCPITIHTLLYIADSIEETGPPIIKSKHHPDACIAQYIVEEAQLTQAALIYNMAEELSLCKQLNGRVAGQFTHESYPTCVLLPPRQKGANTLDDSLYSKILKVLATQLDTTPAVLKCIVFCNHIEQRGKVHQLEGGDTMIYSCDATFVRYKSLVDRNAHQRHAPSIFEQKTYYGQLQHLFVINVPTNPTINLNAPLTIFFAALVPCLFTASLGHLDMLDIHYYSAMGTSLDIVDIVCIQCLVGQVPLNDNGQSWAIIDRSGDLAHAVFED
ncbi:hypothetical protein BDR03DRAFT_930275 [Suillus americanus]|nr:hypothetical protein BDR03DRAFT_930275 [Suillus americanus]